MKLRRNMKRLSLFLAVLLAFVIVINVRAAQAPFNNANTFVTTLPAAPQVDIVSTVAETYMPASSSTNITAALASKVQLLQDLANAAKGNLILSSDGTSVVVVPSGTAPVPNALINAILVKNGITKVYDPTGVQIFP